MVTMNDVSRHAGVSVATVSNVITGKRTVSEDKRRRVIDSIDALGYQVNLVARGLKTQRTSIIGLILPDITKLFFQNVIAGIIDAASQSGYRLNILSSDYNFENERSLIDLLKSSRVDGIILDSCVPEDQTAQWLQALVAVDRSGTPVVLLESTFLSSEISSVTVDNACYSGMITQHLLDIGRRRILYLAGPLQLEHEGARLTGYKDCLKRNGIPHDADLEKMCSFMSESGYLAVVEALKDGIRFDAVQASNDQAAIGALKALQEYGLRVPLDVAVTGFDNLFPSTLVTPALTTISIPNYDMGVQAVNALVGLIGHPEARPVQLKLDASMVIRASTSPNTQTDWNLNGW
ncbi:MAG: LacI family DNA-binding transcriptional regulator [Clostridia bacterium]|nr:LacI family DNA-binding transcriptional regulator [Clostridia bacterium]